MANTDIINSSHRGVKVENAASEVVVTAEATLMLALSDETSDLTTGTAVTWVQPFNMTLTSARITSNTTPGGVAIIVDVTEAGTSIFSVRPAIEPGDTNSDDGGYPGTFSDTTLADGSVCVASIPQVGSTDAGTGLKLVLKGYRA